MRADEARPPIETDAVVIGAGPVGLFQVFQLGLQEIRAQVIDSLPQPGGQCVELYADKPIYDIPGLPVCSGQELADRLRQQIAPFGPGLHLGQEVTSLEPQAEGGFLIQTSAGTHLRCKVVVIAAGVGAFTPRSLKLAGLERHAGKELLHRLDDATRFAGQDVVIAGDTDAAVQAALALASTDNHAAPRSITLTHRRDEFRAEPAAVAQMRALCEQGRMRFVAGPPIAIDEDTEGRLRGLQLAQGDGDQTTLLPLDSLLVLLGLSPRLGPIADWGLALERRQLVVDTARFETSVPGIFAVGDINTYPGKRKLILCGFHEATLAAFAAAERVHPGRPVQLQYTTTSPQLHKLLGVERSAG